MGGSLSAYGCENEPLSMQDRAPVHPSSSTSCRFVPGVGFFDGCPRHPWRRQWAMDLRWPESRRGREPNGTFRVLCSRMIQGSNKMIKAGILWLLGVPLFVIILLALFTNIF